MGDVTYLIPHTAHGGMTGTLPRQSSPARITFTTADVNVGGMWDGTRYVVKRPGTYEVVAFVSRGDTVTNTDARIQLLKNGAVVSDSASYNPGSTYTSRHGGHLAVRYRGACNIGDYFDIYGNTEQSQDGIYGIYSSSISIDRVGD